MAGNVPDPLSSPLKARMKQAAKRSSRMDMPTGTALIVGASRGLGLGLAREYAARGWRVIGTVRSAAPPTGLHALAAEAGEQVRVEMVDINVPDQVAALRQRLAGERIDLLFVNAGISNGESETVALTTTAAFATMMLTNALSPLRVVEACADLVPADGLIAAMSSDLGSVARNTHAGWEIYRASKAALNTMLRSFAVRRGGGRTVLAVAPGWVRTDMGGPNAVLDVATSVRGIADAIAGRRGLPGAAFVDYQGRDVPW
jgi:NAD(P)-dependent dehydrogenase (short-subunit alcohol dehydrogenase family)